MKKENPKILNDFLRCLLGQNYSIGTVNGYAIDLLIFFRFIITYLNLGIQVKDIDVFIFLKIQKSDIIAFTIYLGENKENCANTRHRKIASIKAFYDWLYKKYSVFKDKKNPTKTLPNVEKIKRIPKHLNLEDAKKIQNIFNASNSRYYIRDNTIISLFLCTGMWLSELANIKIKDINFENKSIRIIGKGNKERIVYLTDKIIKQLKEYLSTRKIIDLEDYLFVNNKNTKLSNRSIENICDRAFKLAGLNNKKYTVHTLRHTFATYIYKQTKDILVVKEILGHERLDTTMIYTHVFNDDLKKAVNSNPLNNFKIEKTRDREEKVVL